MATSRRRSTTAKGSASARSTAPQADAQPSASGGNASGSIGGHSAGHAGPRVLKKYPNRRLYDTETSSYITLQDVKSMVLRGQEFQVLDAKTAEDITRSILLQIILEEETAGVPMFSTAMLANIIRFYGHAMQGMMGHYLEHNLQAFADLQQQLSEQSKTLYDPTHFNTEAWTQWARLLQSVPGFPGFPPMKK